MKRFLLIVVLKALVAAVLMASILLVMLLFDLHVEDDTLWVVSMVLYLMANPEDYL